VGLGGRRIVKLSKNRSTPMKYTWRGRSFKRVRKDRAFLSSQEMQNSFTADRSLVVPDRERT
jgi:hypothetical protein